MSIAGIERAQTDSHSATTRIEFEDALADLLQELAQAVRNQNDHDPTVRKPRTPCVKVQLSADFRIYAEVEGSIVKLDIRLDGTTR